jgi:hypothetical protein
MAVVVTPSKTVRRRTVIDEADGGTVVHARRSGAPEKRVIFRTYQVIWYVLGVFETLLILRFIFRLSGASTASSFVRLIYGMSEPLVAPFRGIYPTVNVARSYFEGITIVAMIIWFLIAWGLIYLFQLVKPVEQAEVEETVDNV